MNGYIEDRTLGNSYRKSYLEGVRELVGKRQELSEGLRREYMKDIFSNPERYRQELKNMLGWPLTEVRPQSINTHRTLVVRQDDMTIYRMEFEVFPDLWFYGLLFLHNETEKLPLVISQHGGLGTPELCSGLWEGGSSNYNSMTERIFNKHVNVFAPQMLLWNMQDENDEIDGIRRKFDNDLKQLGGSITALEVFELQCALDCLTKEPFVDENKIGMVGLSYGGHYTVFAAAVDTRIKSSISCSQFSDHFKYGWSDWTWFNSGNTFMDAETALLIYPRKFCIGMGNNDPLFDLKSTDDEIKRVLGIAGDKTDWISYVPFDGTHEFFPENDELISNLVEDLLKQNK